MIEVLIGAGIVIAGMVLIVALIAFSPVTLFVGMVAFSVAALYMVGWGITHGSAPHESWPLIVMVVGFMLCILGGAADA